MKSILLDTSAYSHFARAGHYALLEKMFQGRLAVVSLVCDEADEKKYFDDSSFRKIKITPKAGAITGITAGKNSPISGHSYLFWTFFSTCSKVLNYYRFIASRGGPCLI